MPADAPPPLPVLPEKDRTSWTGLILSVLLLIFLAGGLLSLADDLLMLIDHRELSIFRALGSLAVLAAGGITYLLVALFPRIPKRVFLPLALFVPTATIATLPLLIHFPSHFSSISIAVSILHTALALQLIRLSRGDRKLRWPFFAESSLRPSPFRWTHAIGVSAAGLLILLPLFAGAIILCARHAVDHFSDGFVTLTPAGVSMQARTYVRDDGRTVHLVPMSHVGEEDFYQNLSESIPENAIVLMEGVSDHQQLFRPQKGYTKMAEAIGAVEQQQAFKPRGLLVPADVDMSEFSPATREMLKNAMLIHTQGITPETLPYLMKPTPKGLEKQLMEDILTKRNQHLLKVLHEKLEHAEHIVIPWGAAHMPEIAREIQKTGFRLKNTHNHLAIRFGS